MSERIVGAAVAFAHPGVGSPSQLLACVGWFGVAWLAVWAAKRVVRGGRRAQISGSIEGGSR